MLVFSLTSQCDIVTNTYDIRTVTVQLCDGYAITSILNTNDTEVNVQETLVELDEVDQTWERDCRTEFESQDREKEIQTQLRLDHLNTKERQLLVQTCLDYQDIFYLPGDKWHRRGKTRDKCGARNRTCKYQTLTGCRILQS